MKGPSRNERCIGSIMYFVSKLNIFIWSRVKDFNFEKTKPKPFYAAIKLLRSQSGILSLNLGQQILIFVFKETNKKLHSSIF